MGHVHNLTGGQVDAIVGVVVGVGVVVRARRGRVQRILILVTAGTIATGGTAPGTAYRSGIRTPTGKAGVPGAGRA